MSDAETNPGTEASDGLLDLPIWQDEDETPPEVPGRSNGHTSPRHALAAGPTTPADTRASTTHASSDPTSIPGLPTPGAQPGQTHPGAAPTRVQRHSTGQEDIDWAQVAVFREQASDRLAQEARARGQMSDTVRRELGRAVIMELLDTATQQAVANDRQVWSVTHQEKMAAAIYDGVFDLGRLQPLVDDQNVENIEITGCDQVILEYSDGSLHQGPPVAGSDEELIDFLTFVGSRSKGNARPFSQAQPRLHMRLDNGARLAATAWVTPRPAVVIRRHRLREVTLADLVDNGTITPVIADFLGAAIRARKSVVVSGGQAAGKTTLVRALCAEIDPWERIGTFETEYELHLHEMPDKHRRIVAWEARPGSGEVGADGKQAGEISLDDLLYDSFRFNLSRQIVGEVRGREALAMIRAMRSGTGSISTTHAGSALGAIDKLISCVLEAGTDVSVDFATSGVTQNINLVVQVSREVSKGPDGKPRLGRWVSEILAVEPNLAAADARGRTRVFRQLPGQERAVAGYLPDHLAKELAAHGFDTAQYAAEQAEYSPGGELP